MREPASSRTIPELAYTGSPEVSTEVVVPGETMVVSIDTGSAVVSIVVTWRTDSVEFGIPVATNQPSLVANHKLPWWTHQPLMTSDADAPTLNVSVAVHVAAAPGLEKYTVYGWAVDTPNTNWPQEMILDICAGTVLVATIAVYGA